MFALLTRYFKPKKTAYCIKLDSITTKYFFCQHFLAKKFW
jgi:hypothetical protein